MKRKKIKMGTWNEAKKIKMGTWNEAKKKNGHLE